MRGRLPLFCAAVFLVVAGIGYDVAARLAWIRLQADAQRRARLVSDLTGALATARKQAAVRRSATAASPARTPGAPPQFLTWDQMQKTIASNPALRAKYLQLEKAGLDIKWGLLFRILGLSPEKTDQFRALLAQRLENDLAFPEYLAAQGVDPSSPQVKELKREYNEPVVDQIRSLLGTDGFEEYQAYKASGDVTVFVSNFAGALPDTAPLAVDQATQLISTFDSLASRNQYGTVELETVNIPSAVAAAKAVLSPEQFSVFALVVEKEELSHQLRELPSK